MKIVSWLIVNPNGVKSVRKTKPYLEWNEVAIKVNIDVPKQLFERPSLEATIVVNELPDNTFEPQVVIDTVDLIEQQTGAKINFTVMPVDESPTSPPNNKVSDMSKYPLSSEDINSEEG